MFTIFLRDGDARLVHAVLAGRADAFDRLVRQYLPMVHALACAHAGGSDAEDIAQEAFLLAYHKLDTLREPRKFAGWLATITRNVARRAAEKRAREIALDDAPEALPAVGPAVERRELHALLREHLNRMADEPREVLLLHYFAGRTLSEIARVLEITQDAAAKRLQRARQALGEQLLREVSKADLPRPNFDVRRRAILAAIVATPAAWQAAAAGASMVAAAGAGMSLAGKTLIGAALAATVVFGMVVAPTVWQERSGETAVVASSVPASIAVPSADVEPATAQEAGAVQQSVPLPHEGGEERTGPGVLRGRVVDGAGNPVAGVEGFIELVDWEPPETPPEHPFRRYGETGADGFAEIRGLPLGYYGIIVWKGSKADAAMFYLSERRPVEEETLVLKPMFPVSGRVLDPAGAPVAGACVFPHRYLLYPEEPLPHEMTYPARQRTDADGRFTFPHLPPGSMQFLVEAPGYPGSVSAYIASGVSDAVITLASGGHVAARVIDHDTGAPAPNVAVHFRAENEERRTLLAVSDAKGTFTIGPLAPVPHTVVIADPVLITAEPGLSIAPAAGKTINADIPVMLGATVFGRVTIRETGEPVAGAHLAVFRERPRGYREAESDAAGLYALQGLEPGTWNLNFNVPKGQAFGLDGIQEKQFTLDAGARNEYNLSIRQGVTLTGRVIDEAGNGVPGVEIRTENRRDYTCYLNDVFSGFDGSFRVGGVPPDCRLDLYAWACEQRSYIQMVEVGPIGSAQPEILLTMPDCAEITGSISMTGFSILEQFQHRHKLRLKTSDERISERLECSADMAGTFAFRGIPPGKYEVHLRQIGAQSECLVNMIALESGQRLDLGRIACVNMGGLAISGRVLSPEGRPVRGAEVRLQDIFDSSVWSGLDGRFRLTGLDAGSYLIAVSDEKYTGQAVEVEAGADDVTVTLESGGRIAGRVKDAQTGKPITQCSIRLEQWSGLGSFAFGRELHRIVTDDKGEFTLEDVPAGSGKLLAEAPEYVLFQDRLSLESGGQVEGLEIVLSPGRCMQGVVNDPDGAPVADADVRLYLPDATEAAKTQTDEEGGFLFENVHPDGGFVQAHDRRFAASVRLLTPADIRAGKMVVTLDHGGAVEGRIRVGDQAPERAQAFAWHKSGSEYPSVFTPELEVGTDGTFRVEKVASGEYRLLARILSASTEGQGSERSLEKHMVVERGRVTPVEFQFDAATAVVEGVVQLVGMPQQTIHLLLYPMDGDASEHLSTSTRNGAFRFPAVPAGPAAISTSCRGPGGYYRHSQLLEIAPGAEIHCEFVLQQHEPFSIEVESLADREGYSVYFVPEALASYLPSPLTPEAWHDDYRSIARFLAGSAGLHKETRSAVDQIAPGEYQMLIHRAIHDDAWNTLSEQTYQQRATITGQPDQIIKIEWPE